ncbi:EamA family transporter [Psychrilyobacter atlanticus]|uniref:EamA family transporter n=1 Tax=Psychrilyobacter atlanticus TaxID=271091 RepID=UPI00040D07E7|nr:EamA family transporter [Psychrilyobacter atlanticus]
MEKNESTTKYIIFVLLGAVSYGVLSTFVKLAYGEGFTLGQIVFSQAGIGCLVLWLMVFFKKLINKEYRINFNRSEAIKLIFTGIPIGLTSIIYYKSVQEIPASMAILLLFQFTWMGNLVECVLEKKLPSKTQVISIILLLIGTAFSSNVFDGGLSSLTFLGIVYGLLAACSYTAFTFVSGKVALNVDPIQRSALMLTGALTFIVVLFPPTFLGDIKIVLPLLKYGVAVALFGTIIPPLFFSIGVPVVGVGLTSILASIELPVATLASVTILHERSSMIQWVGILIILFGIVFPRYIQKKFELKHKIA